MEATVRAVISTGSGGDYEEYMITSQAVTVLRAMDEVLKARRKLLKELNKEEG